MSAKEQEEITQDNQENTTPVDEVENNEEVVAEESNPTEDTEEAEPEPVANDPEAKYNELNDKYLRLYSDFENFRRRTAKERLDLIKSAGEEVIKELLPVLDDFERAAQNNEKVEDAEAIKEGFKLLQHKFRSTLNSKGLTEMELEDGEFDVNLHEAITKIPAPSKKLKGKVVDVVEKGYYLNDKVIRYAKVVIGE